MNRASLDGHGLAAHYEALRQNILDPESCRHTGRGLALFMRKGMATWMTSVGKEPMHRAVIPAASAAPRMPEGFERSLIDILAAMALANVSEGRRDV